MRLLNTKSLKLKDFFGSDKPPYAILSHTWGEGEVLFEDVQNNSISAKSGHTKVLGSCTKAIEDGFEWIWIDTCCIQKSSSAELSEAINSMFMWYRESTVCYAYLQDVSLSLPDANTGLNVPGLYEAMKVRFQAEVDSRPEARGLLQSIHDATFSHATCHKSTGLHEATSFTSSRWFTRGWTLQELIAPRSVEFFTAEWIKIGSKATLCRSISDVTGIPTEVLRGAALGTCNVAQKMAWASQRQTTRIEDVAYCLIGLFGVSMPLLYGEGGKAFIRLQEEILKLEEDYSILAWSLQYDCADRLTGLFASSPANFSRSIPFGLQPPALYSEWSDTGSERFERLVGTIYAGPSSYDVLCEKNYKNLKPHFPHRSATLERLRLEPMKPPALTSRGLRLTLPVKRADDPSLPFIAWIFCENNGRLICIILQRVGISWLYARHSAPYLISLDKSVAKEFTLYEFYLHPAGMFSATSDSDRPLPVTTNVSNKSGRISIITSHKSEAYTTLAVGVHPSRNWSLDELFFKGEPAVIGALEFECFNDAHAKSFVVLVGICKNEAWCEVLPNTEHKSLEDLYNKKAIALTSIEEHDGDLDMSVYWLDDDWCFSASIGKLPSHDKQVSYALRVHGCSLIQQDLWVGFYLRENSIC